MNTCPSDSKLLGSRYSKSATEREGYPAGRGDGDAGGPGGRETDREREGKGTTTKKKAFAALGNKRGRKRPFCCRWHRTGRNVTAKSGEVCPSRLEFARSRAAGGCVRAAGGVYAGTHRHTHIYICAHMYIYACLGGRGGRLSLGGVGEGREPHAALLAGGGPPEQLVVGGKNKKRSFQASTWPNGEPCRGQSNQRLPVPQSAVQRAAAGPLPPQAGGTPMGTGAHAHPPARHLTLL